MFNTVQCLAAVELNGLLCVCSGSANCPHTLVLNVQKSFGFTVQPRYLLIRSLNVLTVEICCSILIGARNR